jgi:hypothetical protein
LLRAKNRAIFCLGNALRPVALSAEHLQVVGAVRPTARDRADVVDL